MKTVAIVSGGMDSVTLAHVLADRGDDLIIVSIDYGQRHVKELRYAKECADRFGAPWSVIDLTSLTRHLKGSSLTDPSVEVPDGHYEEESMRLTVVPNRNATMLSVATAIAVAEGAGAVATGVHAGDHAIYPDCRKEFVLPFADAMRAGNEGFIVPGFVIETPFIDIGKHNIAEIGDALGVPWEKTWSCYKGGELHCGKCSTCVERREAFDLASIHDPTEYADTTEYWRSVTS